MNAALTPEVTSLLPPESKKFAPARKRFHDAISPHLPALVLDAEGTIQHLTPAARHLLEYKLGQEVEPCFFSHVHGRNLYQVMRDIADMVCYGKSNTSWLMRLRTGQNRWRWYKATVTSQLTEAEPTILITLRDLHEW